MEGLYKEIESNRNEGKVQRNELTTWLNDVRNLIDPPDPSKVGQ